MRPTMKQLPTTRRLFLYMTTCPVLDSISVSKHGAHCTRASKQTTTGHPDRHADGNKQSHCLIREEQTHLHPGVYARKSAFVEKSARIEIVMKTQHFRNRSLVSLNI